MAWYPYLKFAHVLFAIVALGANLTYPLWQQRAERSPEHLPFTLRSVYILDSYVANPAYVLGLLSGLTLVWLGGYDWHQLWISGALVLFALIGLIGFGFYTPGLRRQIAALDQFGAQSPEYQRINQRQNAIGSLLGLLVLAIVFLMIVKPG
jgi:uncharacterized membrane protein